MSSDLPHLKTGTGLGRRRAETARTVPTRPKIKQRSEKTRMGKGRLVGTRVELGFCGLRGLEVYEVGREGEEER